MSQVKTGYIELKDLRVYQLSRSLSQSAWIIYQSFSNDLKWSIGQQFIRSIDSVGANVSEGYGRYHYLDRVKFYYNARGSYFEAIEYWLELLFERELISSKDYENLKIVGKELQIKLNLLIRAAIKAKK